MSTEDVIELGSSDDEKEPAAKKKKIATNAMVHIPNPCTKLPGITIKPAHKVASKVSKLNADKGKVTGNKINTGLKIHLGNKIKIGNMPSNMLMNPKMNTKFSNRQLEIKKRQGMHYTPISGGHTKTSTSMNIKPNLAVKAKEITQGSKILKNLPAGITIKRANNTLRRNPLHIFNTKKKIVKESSQVITTTVEIEDEEVPSASMPLWYKRPEEEDIKNEDQNRNEDKLSMEKLNNSEPDVRKFVEIIIEDSPIKPAQSNNNINACAIIIEDSPIKSGLDKAETVHNNFKPQDKQSKKKLGYPHQVKIDNNEMIEIEVDLNDTDKLKPVNNSKECTENKSTEGCSTPEKDTGVEGEGHSEKQTELKEPVKDQEFHPVYQKFIETCFSVENSEDMIKIVEKKIKAYYKQCSKEYVLSEEFIDLVSGKIIAIEASPDKMYLYIKDVVDELNMQRKLAKATSTKKAESQEETEQYEIDGSGYDSKRQRQIRKLEKTLKKLHKAILKLEEQEVDFDDEDDSVYLLTERYKERLVKVHAKFCQLTNSKMPSEPSIKLEVLPGHHPGPNKRVEKLINKKVPIGAPLPFPDFHDVLRCVRDANEEDKLHLSETEMIEEARSLFISCGKKLQRRRQENEWRIAASRLPINEDPAEKDENLKKVLETNTQLAKKRESEVFNKYVDRQIQLKLEAEEIGDKEAEESPIESEEEEIDQSNRLENKKKRKDRLKRLLQEKSKVDVEKSEVEEKNKKVEGSVTEGNNEAELLTINDDDKSKMESDVDELHLLQKLYSESDADSSESPISLSDSEDGSEQRCSKELPVSSYDIISIENSSYSESENNTDDLCPSRQNVENVKELQDSRSTADERSIEIEMVNDVDMNKKENCYEINSSPVESEFFKATQLSSEHENFCPDLIKNVRAINSARISKSQEVPNLALKSDAKMLLPSEKNIPEGSIGEADENILLESSDDDNDTIMFKEPNSLNVDDDNISTSKMSICNIESNQTFDKHVEVCPLDATENINEKNHNNKENLSQSYDKGQAIHSLEETSKDEITSFHVSDAVVSDSLIDASNKCD